MKAYHIKPGIIISACIGMIMALRQFFIGGFADLANLSLAILNVFILAFACWLVHQYLYHKHFSLSFPNKKWVKAIGGILACILLAYGIDYLFWLFWGDRWLNDEISRNVHRWTADPTHPSRAGLEKVYLHKRMFYLKGIPIGVFQFFNMFYINSREEAQKARIEIERLKQENLEARLSSLKEQVSPHFLFNSLNTLHTMATDRHTRQYVMQLSHVYRYLLSYNDHNLVTVADELAFTRSYLYILEARFENALRVEVDVPDDLLNWYTPPLSLQLLIENAIKHNVVSAEDPLRIRIYTGPDRWLTVENNLQPRISVQGSTGTGLQNIHDRYCLLSGQGIHILKNGQSFVVRLPLFENESAHYRRRDQSCAGTENVAGSPA